MNRLRLTIVFVGFGVLIVAFYGLSDAGDRAATVLAVLHQLRDFGVLGWIIFIGLQTLVALVGFLPASLLGIAAGAIYGMVLGFGLSAIGVVIGAEISFLLARSALRPKITKLLEKRAMFKKLDQAVTQDGWRLVLLLRVSPVMPFSLTSFALGLSGIRRQAYSFGTLASLPALLLYVVAGHLGKTSIAALHRGTSILHLLVLCVGIISTIFLTVRGGHLIARAIRCP
jgi:uncharacterized membrane protein YdjX (TVP38/TMEM64 family)